jgi:N-acetyl-anhydromuramyl-L-alanine amidase AmpD
VPPLTIEAVPSSTPVTSASPTVAAPRPAAGDVRIVPALIPYPATRQQEMAAYSLRHYGTASWQLTPTMIVLHYTAGGTWTGARATFAADTVNMGELPGTCSHYLVDKDGTVYQLVPTSMRCRHTVGLNDQAIGVEMVQEGSPSADRQILDRAAQVGAALALVRRLQAQFGIPTANVIGHAMANAAPQFHDLRGWRNDHTDWAAADVAEFRSRL